MIHERRTDAVNGCMKTGQGLSVSQSFGNDVVLEIADMLRSVCVNHSLSKLLVFLSLATCFWVFCLTLYRGSLPLFHVPGASFLGYI